jgi:hypothetical protein
LEKFPVQTPHLWGLDLRWKYQPLLSDASLDRSQSQLIIPIGSVDCAFLGNGWDGIEKWGETCVRAILGRASLLFLMAGPMPICIALRVFPYAPDASPPLKLTLILNGIELGTRPVREGWNILEWEADAGILKKGVNELLITPNRTIRPSKLAPRNKDERELSVWVEKAEIKIH